MNVKSKCSGSVKPDPLTGLKSVTLGYATTLLVIAAVEFRLPFLVLCRVHPGSATRTDLLSCFAAWDGEHYVRIASEGYSWHPERMSNVAFFPAYPVLGAMTVALIIGFATATRSTGVALIPVFCLWLWRGNLNSLRSPPEPNSNQRSLVRAALLATACLPVMVWGLVGYMAWLNHRLGDRLVFTQRGPRMVRRAVFLFHEQL